MAVGGWQKVVDLLGFNLGIEAMQLIVVCLTMPLLLSASRTSSYPFVRIAGGSLAALVAMAWIGIRLPVTYILGS